MINEIKNIVEQLFNNPKHSHCVDCINEVFDYFGEHINEKNIDIIDFNNSLLDIFTTYKFEIKEKQWIYVRLGSFSSISIPYKALWDLFESEQKKHL